MVTLTRLAFVHVCLAPSCWLSEVLTILNQLDSPADVQEMVDSVEKFCVYVHGAQIAEQST